jgi:hypothetical protein
MNSTNLYVYSIVPAILYVPYSASNNISINAGVVTLKQKPIYVVHSKYPDYEYQVKLLYMDASSLRRNDGDHSEAVQLAKRYESIFGEHTFTRFKTGELFERSL